MKARALFHPRRCRLLPQTRKPTSPKTFKARPVVLALESRDLPSGVGLVAAYDFGEGGGTTVADASGNGNTGTLHNVAWSAAGVYGNALSFNGNNSIVDVPDSAALHLTTGMTLEAWVRQTGGNHNRMAVIAKGAPATTDYALDAADGPGVPPAVHADVGADTPAVGTRPLPQSSWNFLAGTYDGSNLRLYENGRLIATRALAGSITDAPFPLHLGGDGAGDYFHGLLSQVRVYRRALSQAEIKADMQTPVGRRLVANAGPARTVAEGGSVIFAGVATGGTASLTYAWDFGDGGSASGTLTPAHAYAGHGSYTATLTVTDAKMHSSVSTTTVTVTDVPPTAHAGGPYTGTAGAAVAFHGSATDPGQGDGDGFTWSWSFGDGSTGTGRNSSHAYAAAGTYPVTLTVREASGLTGSETTTVTVSAASPFANAGPAQAVAEGGAVTFAGAVTGGTAPFTYVWNFGDGASASGTLTPAHTYAHHGSYTATLTVTDGQSRTSSSSTTVTATDLPPVANAGGSYTSGVGVAVAFHGSATDPGQGDSDGFTWSWSFGDGSTSTVQNPTHAYLTAGTYHVTLTVREASGLAGVDTTTVTVHDAGLADQVIVTHFDTIPNFGYAPTIVSVASGNWSDPHTWSLGRLPATGDVVDIMPGNTVTYDVNSSAVLNTIAIQDSATLRFRTDIDTQVIVGNFEVLPGGYLEVGTAANPVADNVLANIVIANQPIDTAIDPRQFGTGLIVMGKMTTHGAPKTPYVTLAQEPHAGDTTLRLASPAVGWHAGDLLVLPDTRQLNDSTRSTNYRPQWEELVVGSVSADGLTVTLTAPLRYDHLGARDAHGVLDYLPHVINREGSIMIGSVDEGNDPGQTRGYTLFTYRADVDVENTGFCELGRTTNTPEDDTTFDGQGHVTHVGTNQGDRAPMTAHNLLGPNTPQADGYQFTLIGNVVDDDGPQDEASQTHQWGIVIDDSHYGLIQDNVVYNTAGAGVGVEDGASSFNHFDANLVMRVVGSGSVHDGPRSGDGFWFSNPNNYVTDNVATDINGGGWDVYSYGFNVEASAEGAGIGPVGVPISQGADPSQPGQSTTVDMNATPLLDFSGNEAYGASSRGFATWWLGTHFETPRGNAGTLANSVVWNQTNAAYFTYETANLVIDGFVARGDASQLNTVYNYSTGLYFGDYMTWNAVVRHLDLQDESTGIAVPSNVGRETSTGTFTVEDSYLSNTTDVRVPLLMSSNGGAGLAGRTVTVQNVQFAHPSVAPQGWWSDVTMDATSDGGTFYNTTAPTEVYVYRYDGNAGDNFQTFYTNNHPANAVTRPLIQGYVLPT